MNSPVRLAALVSHPIQYQAPLFRALAKMPEIELEVLFCSQDGVENHYDSGFGVRVRWDVPLLEGYRYQFVPNVSPRPNGTSPFGSINPQLYGRIRDGRFDALWVHGWSLASHWLGIASAFRHRIPLLLRGETSGLEPPRRHKLLLRRALLRPLFRKMGAALAIGTHNAEFYRSHGVGADRIFSAPYTVDNERFRARAEVLLPQRRKLRREAGLDENLPVILFCGKLQPYKRPLDLLAAYAILQAERRTSLVFVGDGAQRRSLEQFAACHGLADVHFAGFRNQSELPAYYAMADVLVLPSGFERWGLVVNEAMCFGLPIVASDRVGCAADLVREERNGYTFPAGNVAQLADRLSRVLNADTARSFGSASLSLISDWGVPETAEGIRAAVQFVTREAAARK